jgi:hypothetical protein
MSLNARTLSQLEKENIFVDVLVDVFEQSHYGFIKQFNEEYLLLEHYNGDAQYDGIVVLKREDISRIRWDNNDINSTKKIINKHSDHKKIAAIKIDSINTILKSINKVFQHVAIHMQNLDADAIYIGEIEEMDKSTLVLHEFGTKRSLDRGRTMLNLSDITRMDAGGIYEHGILKIHKMKKD